MNLDSFPREPLLFGPSPVHPLDRLTRPPRRRAAVGEARRLQLGHRVRRQQDAQARVPRGRRAREGLRHAGLDRRRAVEPHAAGGGGRRAHRAWSACWSRRAGSTGPTSSTTASATSSCRASWAPTCASSRPASASASRRAGSRRCRRRGARRQAVRHPGRRVRPPARRPRLRALGAGAGRAGARAGRLLRHDHRLLGHRLDAGGHDRRLRRARSASGA